MLRRTIDIPVYGCKVIVVFDDDINLHTKKIFKKHKIEDDGMTYYAIVISPGDNIHLYYILFSYPALTLNTFVHEITHLGAYILQERGHRSDDGDEPLAYLNGYLAGQIEKIMQRNNIEFKKPKLNGKNNKIHGEKVSGSSTPEPNQGTNPIPPKA